MDVEEFFDLGAALGLQARTNSSDEGEWAADSGELLFCKVSPLFAFGLPLYLSQKKKCIMFAPYTDWPVTVTISKTAENSTTS